MKTKGKTQPRRWCRPPIEGLRALYKDQPATRRNRELDRPRPVLKMEPPQRAVEQALPKYKKNRG